MKACGVIAEYNPFHNGHRYQLSEARRMTKSDVMVVAMSGNFVQRGAPALLDKWTRAEIALRNGADIVVEMPNFGECAVRGSVRKSRHPFIAGDAVRCLCVRC